MTTIKPTILGLAISMPILATLAVIIRFHARLSRKTKIGADDYLIVAALIFCYGLTAITITAAELGNLGGHLIFGEDFVPVNLKEFTVFQQTLWIISFLAIPALGFTKLSVLFLYKRIFISRSFVIVSWTAIAFIIGWTITLFLINILDCIPIELNWHAYAGVSGKCLNIEHIFWVVNITDIITDVFILMIPGPQIIKLQMSTTRKVQILCIFGLGFFVVAAGIARTIYSAPGATTQESDLDYTYSRAPAVYWLVIEANIAVVSACLPTIQPGILALKFSNIGSSLQKVVSWRSWGSSTAISRTSSENPRLFDKQGLDAGYQSHTTVESTPMHSLPDHYHQHPNGMGITREFIRTEERV
ncbi:hypothetical protein GGS20DRAFT_545146 [Poronia punctata]|nr:hypothetical protein GGS20DRAFT_545146 [Poronia punctata]